MAQAYKTTALEIAFILTALIAKAEHLYMTRACKTAVFRSVFDRRQRLGPMSCENFD